MSLACSKATFPFPCHWYVKSNSSEVQPVRLAKNQSRLSLQNIRPWSCKSAPSSQTASEILCKLKSYLHCALYRMIFSSNTSPKFYVSAWLSTGRWDFRLVKQEVQQRVLSHVERTDTALLALSYYWRQWLGRAYAERFGKKLGMQCRSPGLQPWLIQACSWNIFSLGVLQREGNVWCAWGWGGCKSTKIAKLAQMCWRYKWANHSWLAQIKSLWWNSYI